MTENKRIHKRIPISGSANVTFHEGDNAVSIEAMISNVSYSGIGIYVDRQLEDGLEASIELNYISSDGAMNTTVMKGHVIYTREMDSLFFTGIEFTDELNDENNKDLYDHIQQALKWY